MKYFDSHAHYYDARFGEEYAGGVDELIDALLSSTVSGIINVGTSVANCRLAIAQASARKEMYTALGIHPYDATHIETSLDNSLSEIEKMIKDPRSKAVALGEIGLDYHYPDTDEPLQKKYFEAQMQLAQELDIPVVIHDRDSHADVLEVIKKYRNVRGILHSFSGSVEMAREVASLGYMISFSGTLTFKNARRPREVAAAVPREQVLIETDCPYLSPEPNRGKRNSSLNLGYVADAIAQIKGISREEVEKVTFENALSVYRIKNA